MVVPSAISYSFADSEVKNKIKYNCKIEGGNGDLDQLGGFPTSTTNPTSGSTGAGASGTGATGTGASGNGASGNGANTGLGGGTNTGDVIGGAGTGGDGGSNTSGPFNIDQAEENKLKEKRNSCTFVSTVVNTINH